MIYHHHCPQEALGTEEHQVLLPNEMMVLLKNL